MGTTGEKLGIPIGIKDFKEIRNDKYYFVDKSELISDILNDRGKVFLFTRPRRFGKSLNLSMLDAFFNLEYKGNEWFNGLKISSRPEAESYKNAYPVISLSMKDLLLNTVNDFIDRLVVRLSALYRKFPYLKKCETIDQDLREKYNSANIEHLKTSELEYSVMALCEMLEQYHGVKPIVLIDEYDHPINNSYGSESYEEILMLLRNFYSMTLKDNDHISFAVMTGVTQIAKEGIFSGLNNLKTDNIFTAKFDERYGFTEPEVKELCSYYGHPEKFDEAKEWYDGYRFGNAEIYNPWSVLYYIDSKFEPEPYWAGTSGNDILDTLLECSTEETFKDLTALGNGDTVSRDLPKSIAMSDLKTDINALFSVLATAGYINAVPAGGLYLLSIPNKEMYKVFYKHITKFASKGIDYYSAILDAAEACNIAGIESILYDFFSKNIPFFVLENEMDYEEILTGLIMSRDGKYKVTMEHETGNGRHDIILERRLAKYPNIVMEFKKAKSGNEAESERLAHEAIEQIHQRDYCKILKGTTYLYGVCFNGKKPKAILEKTSF